MKKIKNVCITIICLFIIGIGYNVKADTMKYYLSTKDLNYAYVSKPSEVSVKRGDYVTVTAVLDYSEGTDSYKINNGNITVRWDEEHLKFVDYSTVLSSISTPTVNKSSNKIAISNLSSTENILSGKNNLIDFKFQVLTDSSIGSTKIYQTDDDGTLNLKSDNANLDIKTQNIELKYNISKSTENKLSSIKIDGQEISGFSDSKTSYEVSVSETKEKVNVTATAKDSNAKVTGVGEKTLNYGANKVAIVVTSESGTDKTYNLTITREDKRSSVNTLKTLVLSNGNINFRSNVNDYTVNVENDVEEITITTTLTDSKSKYVEDYSNKTVKLVEGSNKVQIKVVSEKGDENTYILNINRALNSNTTLKTLKVNDEKIELKEDEFTYEYEVENDVDSITIKATPNDSKAKVQLEDSYELVEGNNEINILVVAASGDKGSYVLNVNRKKTLSKDSLLKSLTIKGYNINFKQDIKTYNLEIAKEVEELEITYETEDENAVVIVEGNKDLINGSVIKVNVKAEDGTYTRYFINIEKPSGGISPVIIIIIVMLLLLGACLTILFIRKKKQKEREEVKKQEEKEIEEIKKEEEPETETIEEKVEKEPEVEEEPKEEEPNIEEGAHIERGAHEYTGEHEYKKDNENDME